MSKASSPAKAAKPVVAELTVMVRGLKILAEVGVNPDEQGRRQPLLIDADLTVAPKAPKKLTDTANYELVAQAAEAIADSGHIPLTETFAIRLAEACFKEAAVRRVRVRVTKPQALAAADGAGAEAVLTRG